MPDYLDLEAWPRRATFDFFRTFGNPYFNVTASVEVGPLRAAAAAAGLPFAPAVTYLALRVANAYAPFRYRLEAGRVRVHDVVHGSQTELMEDERIAFCYADYAPTFEQYLENVRASRRALREGTPEGPMDARQHRSDLVYFSSLPWLSFTSVAHPRRVPAGDDSVPRIVFGRYETDGAKTTMPLSVEAHHALMDGLHAARFFERFEALCTDPYDALGLAPPAP